MHNLIPGEQMLSELPELKSKSQISDLLSYAKFDTMSTMWKHTLSWGHDVNLDTNELKIPKSISSFSN